MSDKLREMVSHINEGSHFSLTQPNRSQAVQRIYLLPLLIKTISHKVSAAVKIMKIIRSNSEQSEQAEIISNLANSKSVVECAVSLKK